MSSAASSAASAPGWSGSLARVKGVVIRGPARDKYDTILTGEAVGFIAELHRKFESTRRSLLAQREHRQTQLDAGKLPDFLPETANVRAGNWTGPSRIPADLTDRRVEITGPVDRKMVINALNSGAKVFMADFEDSSAPTWDNMLAGQLNLRDAVNRSITFQSGTKSYKLNSGSDQAPLATLMVRPRGWHLPEAHVLVDGDAMSASLFDFGLYFFHNAKNLLQRGSGPYFYLPKMESHKEARLWNDVFVYAQQRLGVPQGSIRATVLIETILAAFEMDEIIYELRDHSAGLNMGRWDYIFSYIKKFRAHPQFVLPDRASVTMTSPFLANYVRLLIATCHRRGVHAMGGMAAFIPVANDAAANQLANDKVKADKLREVTLGCDGTWVAHPALIPIARAIFDEHMKTPNQITRKPDAVLIRGADLLGDATAMVQQSGITADGVRGNIDVGLAYTEAWLRGLGCVPLHNMMEDAATAEIARCQIWQWIRHRARTKEGILISKEWVKQELDKHVEQVKKALGAESYSKRQFPLAVQLYEQMLLSDKLEDFLTLVAYPHITTFEGGADNKGNAAGGKVRANL